ncbi:MAG: hypothetical protein A2Y10_14845 [Planctomycetes bacterium GWF2_41_51]|nr:MAG: hypothetical protein A2Y10_14845 [Planctomycetes bacterium GWF2_41_51]HBG28979.1 hypothetical protein [Phycisphaerales bacterium]
MSRFYRMFIITIGITEEQLQEVCFKKFGWEGEASTWKSEVMFDGEGYLYGGMSEEEAHQQIYDALKKINPEAKIQSNWTCMEDLPYQEYGDAIN